MSDTISGDVVTRDAQGRWISPPVSPTKIRDSETARTLARARWDKFRVTFENRLVTELRAVDPAVENADDALALLGAKQALTILDSEKPVTDDLYRLSQMAGRLPLPYERGEMGVEGGVTISNEAFTQLTALIRDLATGRDGYE